VSPNASRSAAEAPADSNDSTVTESPHSTAVNSAVRLCCARLPDTCISDERGRERHVQNRCTDWGLRPCSAAAAPPPVGAHSPHTSAGHTLVSSPVTVYRSHRPQISPLQIIRYQSQRVTRTSGAGVSAALPSAGAPASSRAVTQSPRCSMTAACSGVKPAVREGE
jgi:hypothetical protein